MAQFKIRADQALAVATWRQTMGRDWRMLLIDAWLTGDYRSFRNTEVSANLQELRNDPRLSRDLLERTLQLHRLTRV